MFRPDGDHRHRHYPTVSRQIRLVLRSVRGHDLRPGQHLSRHLPGTLLLQRLAVSERHYRGAKRPLQESAPRSQRRADHRHVLLRVHQRGVLDGVVADGAAGVAGGGRHLRRPDVRRHVVGDADLRRAIDLRRRQRNDPRVVATVLRGRPQRTHAGRADVRLRHSTHSRARVPLYRAIVLSLPLVVGHRRSHQLRVILHLVIHRIIRLRDPLYPAPGTGSVPPDSRPARFSRHIHPGFHLPRRFPADPQAGSNGHRRPYHPHRLPRVLDLRRVEEKAEIGARLFGRRLRESPKGHASGQVRGGY